MVSFLAINFKTLTLFIDPPAASSMIVSYQSWWQCAGKHDRMSWQGSSVSAFPLMLIGHVKNLSLSRSLRRVSVTFFPVLLRLVSRNHLLLLLRLVSETFFLLLLRLVSETFFCFYWDLSRKPFSTLLLRLDSETFFFYSSETSVRNPFFILYQDLSQKPFFSISTKTGLGNLFSYLHRD